MSKEFDWQDTGRKISMGERVGKLIEFLRTTACVHVEERELIGWVEVYKKLFPEDKEFNEWLDKVVIPSFVTLGQGKWYRDTITDLALALSKKKQDTKSVESAADVLTL
jgi:hypothetical protein